MGWKVAACCLLTGAVMFVVGLIFHLLLPLLLPGWQQQFANASLFRPWQGWTSWYMVLHPFLNGVLLTGAYLVAREVFGHPTALQGIPGGLGFGLAVCVAGSLPIYALNYASFQVSASLVLSWVVHTTCQYAAAGAVLGLVA
jgi:hypothetical protein